MQRRHVVLISQIPMWSMGKSVGGPAFHETIRALGERYRVSIVTPRLDYVDESQLPPGVELHQFDHRLHGAFRQVPKLGWATDTLGWYTFQSSAWPIVKKLCEAGDVDLVYGYEIYGVPVARKAADKFAIPMVARYQGTLMSFRIDQKGAAVRFHKHLAALKTPADLIVMTDDGTLGDELLARLGHPAEDVLFLMNGVDRSIVAAQPADVRSELGIGPSTPLLLSVSRLMNWKRVDRVIAAAAELVKRGSDLHLAVVGVGPLEGQLREFAAAQGIADRVHFVGGVPRAELAGYYRTASALLSLYDYSNLANPVIESMLMGTPVFALGAGGTDHLVKDGVNGVLLPSGEPSNVADAIEPYLSDPVALSALGDSGSTWAEDNLWTWADRMRAETDRLERLMDEPR